MNKQKTPPFRADHVGSLLRPTRLSEAREKARTGSMPPEEVRAVEDACIREAVTFQEDLGLESITDGEYRRDYWHLDFQWGFKGIDRWDAVRSQSFSNEEIPPISKVTGRVSHDDGIFVDDFAFLHGLTSRTAKQTIPGPSMIHLRAGDEVVNRDVYPEIEEFWSDWTAAYRAEIEGFYRQGCRYLQIDDVSFAYLCDDDMRASMRARGDDPDKLAVLYTQLTNDILRDRHEDMTVVVHTCRGNFKSNWVAQGGYEPVAETVLGGLAVDGIFMEFDSERAGGFEPLRHVPDGQTVVLGLITTKTPELETADEVKRRIDEASRYMSLDNLCLSPQCGFSSTHHGNAVTVDDQKRKLSLVLDVAEDVWGST